MSEIINSLKQEINKVIIGQENMIDALISGLLCGGHILLEGVPGLAKTTTIKTLAEALNLEFKRVQFTPDLLPSDIIGMEIYNPKENIFSIKKGPIFTNLLLADEINRSPAKVQSALLEAMQERQVTIGEHSFKLPGSFLTLATQNPIESEGAYQLPEAQLDRFMMKIIVGYNTKAEEKQIALRVANDEKADINKVCTEKDLANMKEKIKKIHIDNELVDYITEIIFATRFPQDYNIKSDLVLFGASPRGSIDLLKTCKTHAFLKGREFVMPTDIIAMSKPVLRHRIVMSYEAQAESFSSDLLLEEIIRQIPIP